MKLTNGDFEKKMKIIDLNQEKQQWFRDKEELLRTVC